MKSFIKKFPLIHLLAISFKISKTEDFSSNRRGIGVMFQYLANLFPDLIFFNFLRVLALKLSGAKIESPAGLVIRRNVFVEVPKNLTLGKCVQINVNVFIGSNEKISIGEGTRIGMNVQLVTTNHKGINFEIDDYQPINIEKQCHIGAGAIILPGAYLEAHTIVAPGAIVSGRTKRGGIYAGNPARLTSTRNIDLDFCVPSDSQNNS